MNPIRLSGIICCVAIANAASVSGAEVRYRVLHNFGEGYNQSDGFSPQASLIDVKGTLYGTTWTGGKVEAVCGGACGVVFSISAAGKERVLHNFTGASDGYHPANLIGVNGTIYGTTLNGGAYGFGTLFSITAAGVEKVLYSFGKGSDGRSPKGSMIDMDGKLYGATYSGGAYRRGAIYSITTTGTERVLYSFSGSDGAFPYAGLSEVNGTLYGTTYYGGAYNEGAAYSIDTNGKEQVLHSFHYANGSDGYFPAGDLVDLNGTLYGTTLNGGSAPYYTGLLCNCGTVFALDLKTGVEHLVHSFSGSSGSSLPPDGRAPEAGLIAVKGVLYGTTAEGGAHGGPDGTVFSVTPAGTELLLYSFGPGNYNPVARLIDVDGTFYGTTSTGGKYQGGIVFALTP